MAKKRKSVPPHTHQYHKVKWGKAGTIVWKCAVPGCTHYVHAALILGRECVCHKCGKTFNMTYGKLLRIRPKCDDCQELSGQGPKRKPKPIPIQQPLIETPKQKDGLPDLANINIDELLENL